ncbi:hypothetical protein Tco_0431729 [Tanacetum coccineum]
MPTKIELTLEQSQQGVSNDVLILRFDWKPCKEILLNHLIIGLDDGVVASFQRSRIHRPHAHTHAFKVNRSTSRSLILNFPTIKDPRSQIKNHQLGKLVRLIIAYVK